MDEIASRTESFLIAESLNVEENAENHNPSVGLTAFSEFIPFSVSAVLGE